MLRIDREKKETADLAPYAALNSLSRGRLHPEEEHPYRLPFERDRDRIIHCTAFRRMEYKTQVFFYHEGDYFRTRLTHSLEVSQLSRSAALALNLNEVLAEAVALAHDLGHTPFGHAGERAMDALMSDEGGFEHNLQTLRVVDLLEYRYPGFPGLNLSWEVREGIAKHSTDYDQPDITVFGPTQPSLEGQIVELADEIAYNNHDLDDGLTSKLITLDQLEDITIWREVKGGVQKEMRGISSAMLRNEVIRRIINWQVTDLISTIAGNLKSMGISSRRELAQAPSRAAAFSTEMDSMNSELKSFLRENLYGHYRVVRMAEKAQRILRDMFMAYCEKPKQLPPHVYRKIEEDGNPVRVICDYMAGMTDKFALDEHRKLFDPLARV
ncbi:MAG TPA: deoxyguanosinetriphosphate triphosphohydrolase [Proteobacteria bacterium]|nr:deoxyguanosinetriphosphate triphosphohydrolase [bacterium BMS3Abin14]HDL54162.1 deoxyguanosinetriphosphate triphosphohydrolase [Pseudomonadota bacterium]